MEKSKYVENIAMPSRMFGSSFTTSIRWSSLIAITSVADANAWALCLIVGGGAVSGLVNIAQLFKKRCIPFMVNNLQVNNCGSPRLPRTISSVRTQSRGFTDWGHEQAVPAGRLNGKPGLSPADEEDPDATLR
jgi:hypothetical protein